MVLLSRKLHTKDNVPKPFSISITKRNCARVRNKVETSIILNTTITQDNIEEGQGRKTKAPLKYKSGNSLLKTFKDCHRKSSSNCSSAFIKQSLILFLLVRTN